MELFYHFAVSIDLNKALAICANPYPAVIFLYGITLQSPGACRVNFLRFPVFSKLKQTALAGYPQLSVNKFQVLCRAESRVSQQDRNFIPAVRQRRQTIHYIIVRTCVIAVPVV